ncbi:MAG: hypothetical protein OZ948_15815 [Deltaproteobacteria bacterium]|nr:hypothetical protein [Deltaproteobacteria bacterium]
MRRLLLLALAGFVLVPPQPAAANGRKGNRDEAIRICAHEMSDRFGGGRVTVEEVHRVSRRGSRLAVYARMRVSRPGRDVTRDVDCAVEFSGSNRVVAFSVDRDYTSGGGWGWGDEGGGRERASRLCWREAESVGYPVRRILGVQPAERGGWLVAMAVGHNDQVRCWYRNGVRGLSYDRR